MPAYPAAKRLLHSQTGSTPVWVLAVIVSMIAVLTMMQTEEPGQTSLEDGLGPVVETSTLTL